MLLELFISLFAIFVLLVVTEVLWRTKKLHIESSRKIVHIGTGIIVAFWPYILNWEIIQAISVLFLIVILVSYKLRIFKSIHSTERLTIGELLYPVGIGLCAFIEPAPWIFTIAILHLTLADGLAAIFGVKYGKRTAYSILGHKKSLVGSGVFFMTSFLILAIAGVLVTDISFTGQYGWFVLIALGITILENISWYGLDDISVPLSAIVFVSLLLG